MIGFMTQVAHWVGQAQDTATATSQTSLMPPTSTSYSRQTMTATLEKVAKEYIQFFCIIVMIFRL